ncbi:SRPBCC family protein [Pseudonocardia oroxyli]|uniref:Carbon monoxide dehydrogenase subunit G n=1 Tax=Pseudonocardia oroxyli TaxID=366584 RepID=A0A1G7FSV8_PSEOR|nr:SRPBCC family protein [Pseudonocardia oroxyli]SDE78990.1 Carbon monoxide dehydrogenase subunit G [Pseudonocardia oroxyli]
MQLENKFTIAAPIEDAWAAMNNPETVAPCFPGAALTEYTGDSFTGTVKVKLGPISLTYKGKGTYIERDEANHKVVIDASGRDSRGNGTAKAMVTGTMKADGPDKTEVTMVTDMTITGRPAQFGRGVISDVADKIIGQFASCLADKLTEKDEPAPAAPAASEGTAPAGAATTPVKPAAPVKSNVEAIDLLDTAGAPVAKALVPVAGVLAVLLAIFVIVKRLRAN